MDLQNLTPEQMEKARACKSAEELIALAEEEGIELSDEQLDGLSGGFNWGKCSGYTCPDNNSI